MSLLLLFDANYYLYGSFSSSFAIEMVSRKKNQLEAGPTGNNESLLETYLNNSKLDDKDVVGIACDILLAGIDTVSYQII